MSFECVSQILNSDLTNGTEVAVLVALAHCLNEQTGDCFPSTETISRLARRSPLVVRKALKRLTDLGYISQSQSPGAKRFFSIHLDKITAFEGGKELGGGKEPGGGKELEGEGVKNFRGTPYKSLGGGGKELYPEQGSNKGINKEVNQEEFPPPSPAAKREAQTHLFSLSEIPDAWKEYIEAVRPDLDPKKVFTDFRFYWENGRGSSTRRSDKGWTQSWQTWVRREKEAQRREGGQRRGEEFHPGDLDTTGFRDMFR